jgi:hypothetical protein
MTFSRVVVAPSRYRRQKKVCVCHLFALLPLLLRSSLGPRECEIRGVMRLLGSFSCGCRPRTTFLMSTNPVPIVRGRPDLIRQRVAMISSDPNKSSGKKVGLRKFGCRFAVPDWLPECESKHRNVRRMSARFLRSAPTNPL